MTDRELMQQALKALEKIAAYRPLTFAECSDAEAVMGIAENAIPFLRERLAQPEQEPVGVLRTLVQIHADGTETWREEPVWNAPPQRKPLKLREIEKCIYDANNDPIVACRNVEAAHGIKENT